MKVKNHNIFSGGGALLLVFLAAAPLFLSLAFLGRQAFIRHEMEERLEKEALTTIFVSEGQLFWVKKNKEIRLGKDLFDVKKIIAVEKGHLVTGLYDYDEKNIHQQLSLAIEGKEEEEKQDTWGNWLFKQQYTCSNTVSTTLALYKNTAKTYHSFYLHLLLENEHSVPTPPPRQGNL